MLTVADVGAVMAAKHTPDIIPMCHSIALTGVEVAFSEIVEPDTSGCVGIKVVTTVNCIGQTGVEMEALCAANVALLTIYDMCKAIDRGMRIECVQLEEKRGGKSGVWETFRIDSKGIEMIQVLFFGPVAERIGSNGVARFVSRCDALAGLA